MFKYLLHETSGFHFRVNEIQVKHDERKITCCFYFAGECRSYKKIQVKNVSRYYYAKMFIAFVLYQEHELQ